MLCGWLELRDLLERILPQHKEIADFEVKCNFEIIGIKTMLVNAYQLDNSQQILMAVKDITDLKKN